MQIVYLDMLFLINLIANYFLLMLAARMGGLRIKKILFFVSAVLGAGYAVLPFLGVRFLENPLCKIGVGVLMALVAFGREKRFLRATLLLFGASSALGGMLWGAELLFGSRLTLENGVLYSWVDIRLLLFLVVLSYLILTAVCNRMCQHRSSEIVKVEIFVCGRTLKVMALVDTGNTLVDSVGNCPVLVADGSVCREIFKVHVPIDKPVEAMEVLSLMGEKGVRLLPYHAVGVSGGLLLAVKAEKIVVGDREVKNILIAFSPTPVGEGAGYEALIGGEVWDWRSK